MSLLPWDLIASLNQDEVARTEKLDSGIPIKFSPPRSQAWAEVLGPQVYLARGAHG